MTASAAASTKVRPLTRMMLVDEVAQVLGTSEWMVRKLIRRGDLRAARYTGGKRAPYRVAERDLGAFVAARTTGARP